MSNLPGDTTRPLQVFTHLLPSLLRAISYCNVDPAELFACVARSTGTSIDPLRQTIASEALMTLMNRATERSWLKDATTHFPVALANSFAFDYLQELRVFLLSSGSLKAASPMLAWLPPFTSRSIQYVLIEHDDCIHVRLVHLPPLDDEQKTWGLSECILAVGYQVIKRLTNAAFIPIRVQHRHVQHVRHSALTSHYGCPVLNGCEFDEIIIDRKDYEAPITTANHVLHEKSLTKIMRHEGLQPIVREQKPVSEVSLSLPPEVLRSEVVQGMISAAKQRPELYGAKLDVWCEHLKIERRTLQRRLCATGTSFRRVFFEIRLMHAKSMLNEVADRSLDEVARGAGYKDTKAFNLDFRKATGMSPTAWKGHNGRGR